MNRRDTFLCLGLVALSATAFINSYAFPEASIWVGGNADRPYQASAGTWPRIVAATLALLCGLHLGVERFLPHVFAKKAVLDCECTPIETSEPDPFRLRHAGYFFAVFSAYLLLLQPLGFAIATVFFGMGCILALDTAGFGKIRSLAMAVAISAGIIVLFCRVLYLPLPRGTGVFREISQWIIFR